MRILQINTVCGYGSTGRIAVDIALEAENRGHECYIAYGHGTTTYHRAYQIGTYVERKSHNVLSRLTGRQALYSVRGTKLFIRWIKDLQPDVIHLHNIHGHYLNMEILFEFLKRYDHPVIWTFHDCWPFTGHCAYFDFVSCSKWKEHCNRCPNLKAYPPSLVDSTFQMFSKKKSLFTGLNNMIIVTPSFWLSHKVKESFLSGYETIVINNGIDTNIFKPVPTDELRMNLGLEQKIVLLGVSSEGFIGRKGLNYFVELSKRLGSEYKLILIGADRADRKSLSSDVIAVERTDNINQLVQFYSLADVFINPTLEDNYPTVNLEALSCGTPVLTFDTGGSPESLEKNTGIVISKNDLPELLNAVNSMNSVFKKNFSAICREKAVMNFSKSVFVDKYMQLYKRYN